MVLTDPLQASLYPTIHLPLVESQTEVEDLPVVADSCPAGEALFPSPTGRSATDHGLRIVPSTTSSLTRRYLTHLVEASAHCSCRAGCRKAAGEPCQLAFNPPPPIGYNASLCTTTRASAQLPVLDRFYWLASDPVGPGVCRMLQTYFAESPLPEGG
jgi:hypothetical protein